MVISFLLSKIPQNLPQNILDFVSVDKDSIQILLSYIKYPVLI
jgi:hypothetical protein